MQILSVFKNQLTILTGLGLSKIATNNAKSYQKHNWIYFVTSFSIKLKKNDYKTSECINKSITLSLKKRSKFIKKYHTNPTASNKKALDIQSKKCTSLMNESKDSYIAKMSTKLDNPKLFKKHTDQSYTNF